MSIYRTTGTKITAGLRTWCVGMSTTRAGRDEMQQPVAAPAPSASLPVATANPSIAPVGRPYDTTISAALCGNVLDTPIRVEVLQSPVSISAWPFDPRLSIPAASSTGAAPTPLLSQPQGNRCPEIQSSTTW